MLAFAAIHRQLDGVPRSEAERLVLVQQRLHRVLAWRKARQRRDRVAEDCCVECPIVAWLHALDVNAEHLRGAETRLADLKAGLAVRILREEQQQAAIDGLLRYAGAEPHGNAATTLRRHSQAQCGWRRYNEKQCERQRGQAANGAGCHVPRFLRVGQECTSSAGF